MPDDAVQAIDGDALRCGDDELAVVLDRQSDRLATVLSNRWPLLAMNENDEEIEIKLVRSNALLGGSVASGRRVRTSKSLDSGRTSCKAS